MRGPSGRYPRQVFILGISLLCLSMLMLQGCDSEPNAARDVAAADSAGSASLTTTSIAASVQASSGVTAADVRWVYMSWPIPSQYVSSPLIGSRDGEHIAQLLQWVKIAKPVDGTGLTSPLHGRSMAVLVELNDGRLLQIRPAWTCESEKDSKGNTSVSCKSVENRVWTADPDGREMFAESEPLYRFVQGDYKDWIPDMLPIEAPEQLAPGEAFTLRGHGALTDQAMVSLIRGDGSAVWTRQIAVVDSEWQAEGVIPADLPDGDYEWQIRAGTIGHGHSVKIVSN